MTGSLDGWMAGGGDGKDFGTLVFIGETGPRPGRRSECGCGWMVHACVCFVAAVCTECAEEYERLSTRPYKHTQARTHRVFVAVAVGAFEA